MNVEQVMTKTPWTVTGDATLAEAARIMWERDCGAVPIVDGQGQVAGIITDRDCCMAAYSQDQKLSTLLVRNHMSSKPFSVAPGDDVHDVERLMADRQIRRVPVVDNEGRLLGIVSLADLARKASPTATRKAGDTIAPQEVASTLSSISQDRGNSAQAVAP